MYKLDENTPVKEIIFSLDKITELFIGSSSLAESEVRALLNEYGELRRELTLREGE